MFYFIQLTKLLPTDMKIHIYDPQHRQKIAQLRGEDFLRVEINLNIDDLHTCTLRASSISPFNDILLQGMENYYIEDDSGEIIFGGIATSLQVDTQGTTITLYDHRWVYYKLILDAPETLTQANDVVEFVGKLLRIAQAKRNIPIALDIASSQINNAFRADLHFEVGESIGSALQKIIQTIYARWAINYEKNDNQIIGKLIIRSVLGVTPEGIGISQSIYHSESGRVVTIHYEEGSALNNILSFNFTQDFTNATTRTKVGIKLDGNPVFVDVPPYGVNQFIETTYGRSESFMTDYYANSVQTGSVVGQINQTFPRSDITVTLAPNFKEIVKAGDRVSVYINTPQLVSTERAGMRVDSVRYNRQDGYWDITLHLNAMSPQKRSGTSGLLETLSKVDQGLDSLDKNYFNN